VAEDWVEAVKVNTFPAHIGLLLPGFDTAVLLTTTVAFLVTAAQPGDVAVRVY
jgi:hypothetical protein